MSELMDQAVIGMPYEMAMEGEVARRQFYSRAQSILAEVQALRDQVKALKSDANSYQSGYDEGRRMGTKHRQSEVEQLTRKVEDLRARVVVVPDRFAPPTYAHHSLKDQAEGWNDCLDELARLNGKVVSERLLRKWLELMEHGDFSEGHCMCGSAVDSHGIRDEFRALLQP